MSALTIKDLSVSYGPVRAVEGISLSVEPGEVLTVLGPNGAGKTSLVEAILGRVPSVGEIIGPDGDDLRGRPTAARVRSGIALVPQGRDLFLELTVRENLVLGAMGLGKGEADRAVERALEQFPLLRRAFDRRAGFLSGGEQQTLAVARVLMLEPKVLILDEPSFGLSPTMRVTMLDAALASRDEGSIAVLLAEQFADLAISRSDRAMIMAHGECAWIGPSGELDQQTLKNAYLGA